MDADTGAPSGATGATSESGRVRIAILDDHDLFGAGLSSWLTDNDPGVEVVYVGTLYSEAITHAGHVDVVLSDIELGPSNPPATDVVRGFGEHDVPCLLISALSGGRMVREAIRAGAAGYLPKSTPPAQFRQTLHAVANGEVVISAEMAASLVEHHSPTLSDREIAVLQLYAQGLPLKSVARRLGVSPHTAQEYLKRIRRKYAEAGQPANTKQELFHAAVRDSYVERPQ